MADLTPDQAIEKLRALPEDKQRAVLMQLSPDERKGILGKLSGSPRPTPGRPLPGAPKSTVYTWRNPKEAMEQTATQLGEEAQTQAAKATPAMFRQGKPAGERSTLDQASHSVLSGLAGGGEVIAKYGAGLMDWKTAVGLLVSKLNLAASAAFFATQGAKGAYDAVKSGQATPENVQNLLLALATVAAAGGAAQSADPSGFKTAGELKKSAAEKIQPFARKVTGVEPAAKEAVTKAAEKHGEAVETNKIKRAETMKENLETQRAARSDITREKLGVEQENKGIEAENKAKVEKTNQRGELEKTVDKQSLELRDRLGKVEESVGKEANQKFKAVRAKIGNPEAPSDALIATVKGVEKNILQDIPENIKEFRSILKLEGTGEEIQSLRKEIMSGQGMKGSYDELSAHSKALVDHIAENYGGEVEEGAPVTWDKLQSLKSRLDARLRQSRGMNGDLKRALYRREML
jgi:hypothetical protein